MFEFANIYLSESDTLVSVKSAGAWFNVDVSGPTHLETLKFDGYAEAATAAWNISVKHGATTEDLDPFMASLESVSDSLEWIEDEDGTFLFDYGDEG